MLILPIALTVVTNNPIGIGRRVTLRVGRSNFSVQIVVESLEETFAEVHIADRVDALGELDGARQLSVPVAPVVLNTFHMPLVDEDDDFFAGLARFVYFVKENFILLVNEDLFEFREENISTLNEPVQLVLVETFLWEGSAANKTNLVTLWK